MWQDAVIRPDTTIKQALKVIDEHAYRAVFVVDDSDKFVGIVTDGDVRRGLLMDIDLNQSIVYVTNTDPVVCKEEDVSPERIKQILNNNRFLHVPIVNNKNQLVDVVTYDMLSKVKKRENPVFIMAGGFGTRLRPLTDNCPKPMLKIGDIPILEHIMRQFITRGFYRFFLSTHYLAEQITNYFGDGSKWDVEIQYVHESTPLGTGGALGLLPKSKITEPMIVINGDVMTKIDFGRLVDFHDQIDCVATMCVREYTHDIPFGVLEIDGHFIKDMKEKPTHRSFVNAGIYVLEPSIVNKVKENQKIDLPSLLEIQISEGKAVTAFPIHEYWLDVGRMDDFELATRDVEAGIF